MSDSKIEFDAHCVRCTVTTGKMQTTFTAHSPRSAAAQIALMHSIIENYKAENDMLLGWRRVAKESLDRLRSRISSAKSILSGDDP